MGKSNDSTDGKEPFFGARHVLIREWTWAFILIGAAAISHVWRASLWEEHLASLPRACVADLLCWLEEKSVPIVERDWTSRGSVTEGKPNSKPINPKVLPVLDINKATAADWSLLPGWGKVLSQRTVKYRESLGGFHSIDQLHQVYGLDSAVIRKIRDQLKVRSSSVVPICLDTVSFKMLLKHPLFDMGQTRRVFRAKGRGVEDMETFWNRMQATADERKSWEPYLQICQPILD